MKQQVPGPVDRSNTILREQPDENDDRDQHAECEGQELHTDMRSHRKKPPQGHLQERITQHSRERSEQKKRDVFGHGLRNSHGY